MQIKKNNYQKYADCIRMNQVSAPEVHELFEDEKFYNLCSETVHKRFEQYYTEDAWKENWNLQWK